MPINYDDYPENWLTEIRPRILDRAGDKCEFCGVKNHALILRGRWEGRPAFQDLDGNIFDADTGGPLGDGIFGCVDPENKRKGTKIVLTVAHLDHDPENTKVSDDRLRALCQRCHLEYDKPTKTAKRMKNRYKNSLFPIK